jgi:glucosamine--fructose-6-phosphate aminotransferase (isomerizing)
MSFMLKELLSAPDVIKACMKENEKTVKAIAEYIKGNNISNILTMARGTSSNAAWCFKYAMEINAGIPVAEYLAALTTVYKTTLNFKDSILFVISQSGASTDTLEVVAKAKEKGCKVVGVTNNKNSPLAKQADYLLWLAAGEEKSVAATKTFVAQLCALFMVAAEVSGNMSILKDIENSIPKLEKIKDKADAIDDVAKSLRNVDKLILITRGVTMGVSHEIALKLRECCYIHTTSYSSSEFIHGPLALIDEKATVLLIAPNGECKDDFINISTRLNLLGAKLIAFSDISEVLNISDAKVKMPAAAKWDAVFTYSMALQMFVEKMSVRLGINPDSPRNLKKITITR